MLCHRPRPLPLPCLFAAGAKLWYFLSNLDHDWVDAAGNTVPPTLATRRAFGSSVTCGRFARQWVSHGWQQPLPSPLTPSLQTFHAAASFDK